MHFTSGVLLRVSEQRFVFAGLLKEWMSLRRSRDKAVPLELQKTSVLSLAAAKLRWKKPEH
jgi:hypothetical protein